LVYFWRESLSLIKKGTLLPEKKYTDLNNVEGALLDVAWMMTMHKQHIPKLCLELWPCSYIISSH
jgi:hypothetical protein